MIIILTSPIKESKVILERSLKIEQKNAKIFLDKFKNKKRTPKGYLYTAKYKATSKIATETLETTIEFDSISEEINQIKPQIILENTYVGFVSKLKRPPADFYERQALLAFERGLKQIK
jgi:hypothetical protein